MKTRVGVPAVLLAAIALPATVASCSNAARPTARTGAATMKVAGSARHMATVPIGRGNDLAPQCTPQGVFANRDGQERSVAVSSASPASFGITFAQKAGVTVRSAVVEVTSASSSPEDAGQSRPPGGGAVAADLPAVYLSQAMSNFTPSNQQVQLTFKGVDAGGNAIAAGRYSAWAIVQMSVTDCRTHQAETIQESTKLADITVS